jgi:hypothetical protein
VAWGRDVRDNDDDKATDCTLRRVTKSRLYNCWALHEEDGCNIALPRGGGCGVAYHPPS